MTRISVSVIVALALWATTVFAEDTPTETPTETETPTVTETPTQTPTVTNTSTPTVTNTPTITNTPTVTPTSTNTPTKTPTPTNTAGAANACCQCQGTCANPVAGSCGSCILVWSASCDTATGDCGTYTPTPVSTLTPVSTWTTVPTVTQTPTTVPSTPTVTPTSFGTAGPTPLYRVPQNGNLIRAIAWTTKTAVGTAFDPYVGHKYCIYAIDFNVVALTSTVAVTFAGDVVFESSGPKYIKLDNEGPCGVGPVTITEPTGSAAFRVTIGTYLEPEGTP